VLAVVVVAEAEQVLQTYQQMDFLIAINHLMHLIAVLVVLQLRQLAQISQQYFLKMLAEKLRMDLLLSVIQFLTIYRKNKN
jgi:hypothetical protein